MSIVRIGATKQYADNWENIFGGSRNQSTKKTSGRATQTSIRKKSAKKRPAQKLTARKATPKPSRRK